LPNFNKPERLTLRHDLDDFSCSSSEQTDWLKRFARQSQSTKTFVVTTLDKPNVVVAYYGWRMAELRSEEISTRLRKGEGSYPQPIALLARLGVDSRYEGQGIGAALFTETLTRTVSVSAEIGCRGLLIHAENNNAANFYKHLIPGIDQSPTDELHLVVLTKDIKKTLNL